MRQPCRPSRTRYQRDRNRRRNRAPAVRPRRVRRLRRAMGIDWMTGKELAEAIPPAYTEHIGLSRSRTSPLLSLSLTDVRQCHEGARR